MHEDLGSIHHTKGEKKNMREVNIQIFNTGAKKYPRNKTNKINEKRLSKKPCNKK
jgi:hypothetical protein